MTLIVARHTSEGRRKGGREGGREKERKGRKASKEEGTYRVSNRSTKGVSICRSFSSPEEITLIVARHTSSWVLTLQSWSA